MGKTVGLVVDSTFGLDKEFIKKENIIVVPLKVIIGDAEYVDGSINPDVVVKALQDKVHVKTSQPAPELFKKAFEKQLETYDEVICLTLSKTLSGTVNSANLAKTIMDNDNVLVIDTESTINGSGYIAEKVSEFLNEGHSASQTMGYINDLKEQGSLVFTVDNLQTLYLNGRLSKVSAFIGNMLKIKPILRFRRGVLDVEHKARSFNNVILYLIKQVETLLEYGKDVVVRIAYVDRSTEAKQLEHEIYQLGDRVKVKITGVISPVISAHVGLGGLGIYLAYE
ncbi:MAG: DegV family protein [Acholeplasmataceae bacterium]|nr:DegV family protein [Acholeplasmataceae bacterium]